MMKKKLLVLVLWLVLSWGSLSQQQTARAASSETSQVGIYFDEPSPQPPSTSGERPNKLPQTGNNQQTYLQVVGVGLLIYLMYQRKNWLRDKGGSYR